MKEVFQYMVEPTTQTVSSCKVIHVKVIGGSLADIHEIGEAMREFKKKLPFRLEAIITSDKVELQDVDSLIKQFILLKKQLEIENKMSAK